MPKIVVDVTQSAADTTTSGTILTGLSASGKEGWEIVHLRGYWTAAKSSAQADSDLNAILATIDSATTFGDDDEIARLNWAVNFAANGVFATEELKEASLYEPRVTVQPELYINVASAGTGLANRVIVEVFYNIVKLSDSEVLKLLAGGA